MEKRILVVEDEKQIRENMVQYLEKLGYQVFEAADGEEALSKVKTCRPNLMVLDLMLPGKDGVSVCEHVRRHSMLPIIMVTALDKESDKLAGLESGADDYITKPFNLRELAARIAAVYRRSHRDTEEQTEAVRTLGNLEINENRREVRVCGEILDLTPSEYAILLSLSETPGRPFTRLQLLNETVGSTYAGYERAVDTHVSNLRKKIEDIDQGSYILTVYGLGYKFNEAYATEN